MTTLAKPSEPCAPQAPHASPDAARLHALTCMLSSITDFTYAFDLDGRFTFVNKPLLDLWGLTLDQAVGKNFHDLHYPPDLAEKLQRQIQQVIGTGQRLVDETPYTNPAGATGYYQYIFSPIVASDGTVEAVAGTTRDISEHRRLVVERESLAREVDAQRRKLARVIEQAPAFICTLKGPGHVFELANEQYYQIVGRRDLVGKSVRAAFPDLEGQGFFELLDRVYQTGETFTGKEMPLTLRRSPDRPAEILYINFIYQALRDADGAIQGIFVHGVDVTDLVLSRNTLADTNERYRVLIESLDEGFCIFELMFDEQGEGRDYIFLETNPAFERLTGLKNAPGKTIRELVPGIEPYWYKIYGKVAATGEPLRFTAGAEALDNRFYDAYAFRIGGPGSRKVGVVFNDITERRKLQQEREGLLAAEQAARAQAEAASLAKDKFIAVLSHELRTPLSPVAMTIPAMEIDPDMPFKFHDDLAMIRRNIDLEVKLIDDLLDLSRVASGKLGLHMERVHAHEILHHALRNSRADLGDKRLTLREQFTAASDRLRADPARLQQVFWNLLRNAVKFTPDGGTISVRTSSENGHFLVEVRDTGVGIPPDVLPRVFDAFEQGDARVTRQFGGLGLGLAIAKAVVEMHGGTIHAASGGPNRGATFTVELSLLPDDPAPAPTRPDPAAAPAHDPGGRILFVEDHPDTARVLTRVLKSFGFDVTPADSVARALQLLQSEPFDLLLSDVGLPDASGFDLMRQARRLCRIQGIALSGYGMEEDFQMSRDAGFSDHLVKPVNLTLLEQAIRRLLPASA